MEYVSFVFNALIYGLAFAAFVTPAIVLIFTIDRIARK